MKRAACRAGAGETSVKRHADCQKWERVMTQENHRVKVIPSPEGKRNLCHELDIESADQTLQEFVRQEERARFFLNPIIREATAVVGRQAPRH